MTNIFDILIIGGGAHGASLAFHLSKRGVKVAVLEKQFIAAGATGRSSGLVRMHYDLEPEAQLAWVSYQYFSNWGERIGGECGFTRTGFVQIVSPDQTEELRANNAMLQKIGIPSLLVTAEDVKRLAPSFYTEDFELATYEPESGYADPSATATALMQAAKWHGAVLIQDCLVTGITVRSGKVTGMTTSQGDFLAPVVVNAAGAWAGPVAKMAGLDLPIDTWRHDTMFVKRPAEMGPSHPTVIDFPNLMYFRPETGGLTLVGLEDDNPIGQSPDGFSDKAQAGFTERAIERICRRIPVMEQASLHSSHGGYDGITPDQRPVLGPAGPEGFWLECGFSGTGFKTSPAAGLCMSEWILDGAPKTVDITRFTAERFEKGIQIKGEHPYHSIWT
jgi:sarcosine oxidase subunit beta